MKDSNPEYLERCLSGVMSGDATTDQCLEQYPEAAEELRPLLETALLIERPQAVNPDPLFKARARARLVSVLSSQHSKEAIVLNARAEDYFGGIIAGLLGWFSNLGSRQALRPLAAGLLVVCLLLATSTGAIYAAQDTLPGDPLYQVKLAAESAQLSLAADDETRMQAKVDLAGKRLAEVEYALTQGRLSSASAAADAFAKELAEVDSYLAGAQAEGRDTSAISDKLAIQLADPRTQLVEAQVANNDKALLSGNGSVAGWQASGHGEKDLGWAERTGHSKAVAEEPTSTPTATATATASGATTTATATISGTLPVSFTTAISYVEGLKNDPLVSGESQNGLAAKLEAAQAAAARGNTKAALNILEAFENQLEAFNRTGHISPANYANLKAQGEALMNGLKGQAVAQVTPVATGTPEAIDETAARKDRNENAKEKKDEKDNKHGSGLLTPTSTPVPTVGADQPEEREDNERGRGNQGRGRESGGAPDQEEKHQPGNPEGNSGQPGQPPKNDKQDDKKQEPPKRR